MILSTRYFRIVLFFARAVMEVIFWDLLLAGLGLRALVRRTRADRWRGLARRFRALAIRMGGVLIKVGQFLSARLDVLPEEVTAELAGLQDEVPPEAFAAIHALAEKELGAPLAEKFAAFEESPLAAASLGQVHRARLRSSRHDERLDQNEAEPGAVEGRVVVKIQRPNIETLIATDLAALRTVGGWLRHYPPINKRADLPALLAEFTRTLYEEIDYLAEGRNAETFAANFKDDPGVRVPRVIWSHTTRRVLVLEDVYAIKVTDYDAITRAGIDRARVAERLFKTYLQQIFRDGFFHADPHPGNLFVTSASPSGLLSSAPGDGQEARGASSAGAGAQEWVLTFVDFGMVGRVPQNLRVGLREAVIGVGTKDSARLVKAYQLLGVLLPGADLELLERAEAKAFERFWGKSMTELREMAPAQMHEFAAEFRELLFSMPFQAPEDLILLGRTVAILSGMCTGLDPQFNVWAGLAPFAQQLIAEEATTGLDYWLKELEALALALLSLPKRAEAVLGRMERGELEVRMPDLAERLDQIELAGRRMMGGVIFAALLIGGVQLYLAGQMAFAAALFAGALAALGWVILTRR